MKFYQLKIVRKGTKPPVWRRCLVPADITFDRLADILENILQYETSDLYEFEFFQKKVRVRKSAAEEKSRFEVITAETEINSWMESEKWFTFRVNDPDRELPQYRADIEEVIANTEIGKAENKFPLLWPMIIKSSEPDDDEFWSDPKEVNTRLGQKFMMSVETAANALGVTRDPKVKDYLAAFSREELDNQAKELEISGEGLTTEELAEKIAEKILTPEVMEEKLLLVDDHQIEVFEEAMSKKCFVPTETEWTALDWAGAAGYFVAYSDDKGEVPREVVDVYAKVNTPEFQDRRRKIGWMLDCESFLGFVYAVAPVKLMHQIYSSRQGFEVDMDEFVEIFNSIDEEVNICIIRDDKMLYKAVLENNLYREIERVQYGNEFYIPSPEEVQDYVTNGYPSREPAYHAVFQFMTEEMHNTKERADYLLYIIYKEFSMNGMLSDIMDIFKKENVVFESDDQMKKFTSLLVDANNNTRMLDFRGHTPKEKGHVAVPMQPKNTPITAPKKIYPNDPCPCGSGKKYKKCCGRNK